ncbi:RHS repeat protein [Jiangella gansuensis]|uniref:RHS repeat protein n=1 Tax=Jiangella gansuensis TaxID=281473 RepID=UPI0004AF1E70|nr:RHS repeat protein [Jiangella gansuensis]
MVGPQPTPVILGHGFEDAAARFTYVYIDGSTQRATHLGDAGGRNTTYGYDGNGRLSQVTAPSAAAQPADVTTYEYNPAGLLQWITSPNGYSTRFTYDTSNRVTEVRRFFTQHSRTGDAAVRSFAYNGDETTVTDPNGHESVFVFDSQDRVIEVTDPLDRTRSQTWTPTATSPPRPTRWDRAPHRVTRSRSLMTSSTTPPR